MKEHRRITNEDLKLRPEKDNVLDHAFTALIPSRIFISKSEEFDDGTANYIIYGSFINTLSKDALPLLGLVRCMSYDEAAASAQKIIDKNVKDFIEMYRT